MRRGGARTRRSPALTRARARRQATLNARASILAAANPVWGRYDRTKTLRQNVNLSPPIMSRFDLFFIVVDNNDEAVDNAVARHIVTVHQLRAVASDVSAEERAATLPVDRSGWRVPYSMEELQRYIAVARRLRPGARPGGAGGAGVRSADARLLRSLDAGVARPAGEVLQEAARG